MNNLFFLLFLLAGPLLQAQEIVAGGSVYHDRNGNNQRDLDEPGIRGVVVSDQVTTVLTDQLGNFKITTSKDSFPYLFISMPNGYQGTFFRPKEAFIHFPLTAMEDKEDFSFIHASDTHIDSLNLPRMRRFREMADSLEADFVIVTGDLIRDALRVPETTAKAYYEMYTEEIGKFKMPLYSAVGNHELFGIERDKSLVPESHPLYGKNMYRYYLGPNYYSFNYGGWHFVALDGVQYQNLFYYGGVDSLQLKWLERDLEQLPEETPVVTFNHIPFISPGFSFTGFENDPFYGPQLLLQEGLMEHRHIVYNEEKVRAIIGTRPYPLALAGHFHMEQTATFGGNATRFAQTAAITRPERFTYHGMQGKSGFTLYRISAGRIMESLFVPLHYP